MSKLLFNIFFIKIKVSFIPFLLSIIIVSNSLESKKKFLNLLDVKIDN